MGKMRKGNRSSRSSRANGSADGTTVKWTKNTAQPPPVSNKQSYLKRKLVIDLAAGTALKVSDLSSAMSSGGGDFLIEKISIWAKPTSVFGAATFGANVSVLMTSSGAADSLEVVDSGTGTSRPGVVFTVPKQRAQIFSKSTSDTQVLASCVGADATYHVDVIQYVSA